MPKGLIKTPIPGGGLGWSAIDQKEIDAVVSVLKNPKYLFRYSSELETQCSGFEREACEKLGFKHALMVASGTSALTLCLSAYGIGPGDEVIIPGYTYISTASAVVTAGAVPVIAEIDNSLGLDPDDVEKKITPYTKAIIIVHMQGVPGRLKAIRDIAKKHKLVVIEDACQAIGSKYNGVSTGIGSDALAWSLNFYKVITCGEGGVFFTNDDDAFIRGVNAHDPGSPMWKEGLTQDSNIAPFTMLGTRGNEVSAAIARVQLTKLDGILEKTRALKKKLISRLAKPLNYTLQHVDDPEGDCGISIALIANTREKAQKLYGTLAEEGLNIGTAFNEGFPDRHIYSYWDAIIEKRSPSPAGYPWKDPSYKGNVSYTNDMCPNTLDILGRCMRFGINTAMNDTNMEEIAAAINYADANV